MLGPQLVELFGEEEFVAHFQIILCFMCALKDVISQLCALAPAAMPAHHYRLPL